MTASLRIFVVAIAIAVGLQVFIGVFFAPVLIYGSDDVLLVWGWIAPFVGLPLGWIVGRLAYFLLSSTLSRSFLSAGRQWLTVGCVALLSLASVGAVGQFMRTYGNANIRWSEEVKLSDGRSIVVTRTARGSALGRSRVHAEDWLPEQFTIEASGALGTPLQLSLRPVLLDQDPVSGSLYVLAEPLDCGSWATLGRPTPPYIQYSLGSSGWTETDVDKRLLGRSANLLVSPRFTGEERLISAEQVRIRNNDIPADMRPQIRPFSRC